MKRKPSRRPGEEPKRRKKDQKKVDKRYSRALQFLGKTFGLTGEHFAERIARLGQRDRNWVFTFDPYGKRIIFSLLNADLGCELGVKGEPEKRKVVAEFISFRKKGETPEESFRKLMQMKHHLDQMGKQKFAEESLKLFREGKVPEMERTEIAVDIPLEPGQDLSKGLRIAWIKAMSLVITEAEKMAGQG
jgi:hypothetical protein